MTPLCDPLIIRERTELLCFYQVYLFHGYLLSEICEEKSEVCANTGRSQNSDLTEEHH